MDSYFQLSLLKNSFDSRTISIPGFTIELVHHDSERFDLRITITDSAVSTETIQQLFLMCNHVFWHGTVFEIAEIHIFYCENHQFIPSDFLKDYRLSRDILRYETKNGTVFKQGEIVAYVQLCIKDFSSVWSACLVFQTSDKIVDVKNKIQHLINHVPLGDPRVCGINCYRGFFSGYIDGKGSLHPLENIPIPTTVTVTQISSNPDKLSEIIFDGFAHSIKLVAIAEAM